MAKSLSRRAALAAAAGVTAAGLASLAPRPRVDSATLGPPEPAAETPAPAPPSATPSAPPTPAPATSAPPPEPRRLTVVTSGDLLWHNTLWLTAAADHRRTGKGVDFDFDPMFAMMRPIIESADLAIAHNEVPFAPPGGPYTGYPNFAAPPEIARWMGTMGWDLATTASNHSLDQGFDGLVRTSTLLQEAGLKVVGTYRSEAERQPVVVERRGVRVAVVSGTYDLNGYVPPKGKEWCVDRWDVARMLLDARAARAAGADVVMAHLHGGEEYQTAPGAEQAERVRALATAPEIDLVFGEHVHVVQPITQVGGTWVVYGMGNMVAQHSADQPRGYEGITVRFTLAEQAAPLPGKVGRFAVERCEYVPTLVTSHLQDGAARLYPVNEALRQGVGPTKRLQVALQRTREAVLSLSPPAGLIEA